MPARVPTEDRRCLRWIVQLNCGRRERGGAEAVLRGRLTMSEKHTHPVPLDEVSDELTLPVRVACIDVGSNALRYVAAEFSAPDKYRIVEQDRRASCRERVSSPV